MTRVRFQGIIRGNGREANCTVSAFEVPSPVPNDPPAYSRYKVERVEKPLPEGSYTISVNGQETPIRFDGFYWLATY